MARSRNIKPDLFKNELLGEADPMLTILFAGLWCLADREGKLLDRPKRIKAEIFPYRDLTCVNGYLTELQRLGFIDRYQVGDLHIIKVIEFEKHQSPHKTEKASELPEKPRQSRVTVKAPLNNGTITDEAALIPDSLNMIPDSVIVPTVLVETDVSPTEVELDFHDQEESANVTKIDRVPYQKIVDLYHEVLPELRSVAKLNNTRQAHIRQRWREDLPDLDEWRKYFEYVKASPFLMGKSQGQRQWEADFDFLINGTNAIKIVEGKYHV